MKKLPIFLTALSILTSTVSLTGCSKTVKPGDVQGYDEGEQYISMWVHTIEDTPEGEAYKESVERFNEKYDGTYFADIEFREMTVAAVIRIKSMHLLCREISPMSSL